MNLKSLDRPAQAAIDALLVRGFVIAQLSKLKNAELARYVATEFDEGMRRGPLALPVRFLRDEIPEVLSAEDASDIPEAYATAISEFARRSARAGRTGHALFQTAAPERATQVPRFCRSRTRSGKRSWSARTSRRPRRSVSYGRISGADASLRSLIENPDVPRTAGRVRAVRRPGAHQSPSALRAVRRHETPRPARRCSVAATVPTHPPREFSELIAFTNRHQCDDRSEPGAGTDLVAAARRGRPPRDDPADCSTRWRICSSRGASRIRHSGEQDRFTFSHRRFQEYFTTSTFCGCRRRRGAGSAHGRALAGDHGGASQYCDGRHERADAGRHHGVSDRCRHRARGLRRSASRRRCRSRARSRAFSVATDVAACPRASCRDAFAGGSRAAARSLRDTIATIHAIGVRLRTPCRPAGCPRSRGSAEKTTPCSASARGHHSSAARSWDDAASARPGAFTRYPRISPDGSA